MTSQQEPSTSKRSTNWVLVAVVIVALAGIGTGIGLSLAGSSATSPQNAATSISHYPTVVGPEGVPVPLAPVLTSTSSMATGQPVDGILCEVNPKLVLHVHTHLAVFVNGSPRQIPYGIGIVPPRQLQHTLDGVFAVGGRCLYWLHTHAADGIIHIETPVHRKFTLGNFFNIWGQPLGPNQVGPASGPVTAFVNGKRFRGNPANILLGRLVTIQLDVGKPTPGPVPVHFPPALAGKGGPGSGSGCSATAQVCKPVALHSTS